MVEVVKILPRGYCYGVVDAITMAKRLAKDSGVPRPIVVLGEIVHNQHVVEDLARLGIHTLESRGTRLDLLQEVPDGATVVFTAHGIAPDVVDSARRRGLRVYDATCPDVRKTHNLIAQKIADGYCVIYIGSKGHPEPEGALGVAPPHRAFLVSTVDDVAAIPFAADTRLMVTTQTTLSQWDTADIIDAIRGRYPHVEVFNEICHATQSRQEAAVAAAAEVDMVIVVGDRKSNNSNRLVEVVQKIAHKPAYRVEQAEDLDPRWFREVHRVGVTAGSSTPSEITRDVIAKLSQI